MSPRKSWDDYFMDIARAVSDRATCDRKHVGAIITDGRFTVATGYNGSPSGTPHCDDFGHLMVDGHCRRTVHAEANAIFQAQKRGHLCETLDVRRMEEAAQMTLYTTASPCWECIHRIWDVRIRRVVFGEFYRDMRIKQFCDDHGIELIGPPPEPPKVAPK